MVDNIENMHAWNDTEKAINEAILEHTTSTQAGTLGPTLVLAIYNKLLSGGFLKDQ
jgi:hypothetical protein